MPKWPARLKDFVRLIPRLGGFLGRQGDGEPGVKTLWLGLRRIMAFAPGNKYACAFQDP